MKAIKGLGVGDARWSSKTPNWITNVRNASYKNILTLIWIAKAIHVLFLQPYNVEVKIWKE